MLKEEWVLADLITKGKVLEAAIRGADRIAGQEEDCKVYYTKVPINTIPTDQHLIIEYPINILTIVQLS